MGRSDRLTRLSSTVVRLVRGANLLAGFAFLAALLGGALAHGMIDARLTAKYGVEIGRSAYDLLRLIVLLALLTSYAVERLCRALLAILDSIKRGEPFATANAAHLRTIGWMLLLIQLLDLGLGAVSIYARSLPIDFVEWQPSLTGWIAVLVAFVLARVFTVGAAMRDDLEGTV